MNPVPLLFLALLVGASSAQAAEPDHNPDPVTVSIATLLTGPEPLVVDGRRLDARALRQLYEPRGYRPVWVAGGNASARAAQVAAALSRADAHGLDPATYHVQAITRRATAGRSSDPGALDLLASDGIMRLAVHLRLGALPSGAFDAETAVESRAVDPQALALEAASSDDVAAYMESLAPQTARYRGLVEALARYEQIARAGGWPVVPVKGPGVQPGASDPVVPLVRARLEATGELSDGAIADPAVYDDALVAAVKAFQERHGIPPDGVLGAATRGALAVPVQGRIGQLVANLERERWFPGELGRRYVAVDVPSFELVLVENGSTVLKMPVVVGRKDRRTPVLATQITELVFNPSWTVPPTLLREDFLPKMQRNPAYLAKRGLQVVGSRSLTLRQPPGPKNPLGRVKFQMPNQFSVYLHDTNAKGLMQQSHRALSSGCVRLGDALGLANRLLANDPRWTPAAKKQYLAGWTTRYLPLHEPVPVYLKYQTAWRDDEGDLQFRDDVYGRDAALAKALARDVQSAKASRPSA